MSDRRIIEVNDLEVGFDIKGKFYNAVDGVSFSIDRGEVMGIVGESGCGKSVLSMSLMKLLLRKFLEYLEEKLYIRVSILKRKPKKKSTNFVVKKFR